MNVIAEHEKQQLLRGGLVEKAVSSARPPKAPALTMEAYLGHVEQLAKLLPIAPRRIAHGAKWKL
jgi:hypothetical protein